MDISKSFLELYEEHTGETEVPGVFHRWAALTLIAACVGDRVWLTKHIGEKLSPNLYTILLGSSGLGKGKAIDTACRLVSTVPRVNLYYGRGSAQFLFDYMSGKFEKKEKLKVSDEDPDPDAEPFMPLEQRSRLGNIFLVTEELALNVSVGGMADNFIKYMTGLYGEKPVPFRDGTVARGASVIKNPCINWLAGSTREWLVQSVTRDAIEGGFFARTVLVEGDYTDKRVPHPSYPKDYAEIVEELTWRVRLLAECEQEVWLTKAGRSVEEEWYLTRERPVDPTLWPSWRRQHDLMLKVATCLALSDWTGAVSVWQREGELGDMPTVHVDRHHIQAAIRWVSAVHKPLPGLLQMASATPQTSAVEQVAKAVQAAGRIGHTVLMQRMRGRGIGRAQMVDAVETLVQEKRLVVEQGAKPVRGPRPRFYLWIGGVRASVLAQELDEELFEDRGERLDS